MGYELREDAMGGEGSRQRQTHTCTHIHTVSFVIHRVDGANNVKNTHTHRVSIVIHKMDGASGKDRTQLDTCKRGAPLIKLMGYELRDDRVRVEGSRQWQTHTCT